MKIKNAISQFSFSFLNGLSVLIATCGGIGYFRPGPGTWASIASIFFWIAIENPWAKFFTFCVLLVAGYWASRRFDRRSGRKDSSQIVIDEWLGMGIALSAATTNGQIAIALVLFRVFDISKPLGVRFFDRRDLYGWGVILDDLVAGIYAFMLLGGLRWFLKF